MKPPSRRESLRASATTVALALPAVLLATGWIASSVREDHALALQHRQGLQTSVDIVSAAIREGLEELRAREAERPYYHYSYHYIPPDVFSVQEAVAVSPLGTPPTDERILGHFQLDPHGVVHGETITVNLPDEASSCG